MNGLEYKTLHSSESFGGYGAFGIKILVASSNMPNLSQNAIQGAAYKAADLITAEVRAASIAVNPTEKERALRQRKELLSVFPDKIFVEEIPNGYCSDWCCRHLPWFKVTTEVGRFEIGWRKRVIHINWTETVGTKTAEELFPEEGTTKEGKMIHAWSLEKAGEYISTIMTTKGE